MTYHQNQAFTRESHPDKPGDCFRTTIANLLRINRDTVPHFVENTDDFEATMRSVNKFLRPYGMAYLWIEVSDRELHDRGVFGMHHERGGKSPRGLSHSVAYRGESMEHDPHPSHAGIDATDYRGVFVVLAPWQMVDLYCLDNPSSMPDRSSI